MYSGDHAAKGPSLLRKVLSILVVIAIIFGASFLLRMFVFQAYEIPSGSMEDTIMTNDLVFSEKVTYYMGDPEAGDIVTFIDPETPSRTLIKRVIATEGQVVDLKDGHVYVDGVMQNEPYTEGKPSNPLNTPYGVTIEYPYTVPEGEVWVMGDNRTNSQDSRYFGSVPVSSITGRAVFIYWPLNHAGMIR